MSTVDIQPLSDSHRPWARDLLTERWGSSMVVTRGHLYDAGALPGFVAMLEGEPVGLTTYRLEAGVCEVVTLDSCAERQGVGTALMAAVEKLARETGCRRLWLITTNDNTPALRFYQKLGYELVAVHRHAIAESRKLKPDIPETGIDGIPIRDELELERVMERQA